jgi:hypothetical protein
LGRCEKNTRKKIRDLFRSFFAAGPAPDAEDTTIYRLIYIRFFRNLNR